MDNFFATMFQRREAQPGLGKCADGGEGGTQSKGASFANNVVHVNTATGALSIAAWHRGVEIRCNTMSQLVMEYQKKNDKAHGGNYEQDNRADGKRLNYLLQVQPNPMMTWPQLIKAAEFQRIHQGNALIYIERDSYDEIKAFWLCSSGSILLSEFRYNLSYNRPGGQVSLVGVRPDDVLHIRNTFSNDFGLTGMATLKFARPSLDLAATNDKLVTETAAKGMRQKLLVQEDKQTGFGLGRANKKELEKITDKLSEDVADKDVILLSNIASVTPISTNLQQQEINQIRAFSVAEVARYLGVPKIMLMASENESYKTPEAATQEFLLRTIQPLSHDWETELNAKILGYEGYPQHRFHFNDDSLMRLDPLGRATIGEKLIQTGVKCVNELRADYDLPAVEGGDRHFISTNLQPVDSPTVGQQQEPSGKTSGTVAEEGGDA